MSTRYGPRIPVEPLRERLLSLDPVAGQGLCMAGVDLTWRRNVHRWAKLGGIPLYSADHYAIKWLHVHPVDVWPDWYELASAS